MLKELKALIDGKNTMYVRGLIYCLASVNIAVLGEQ